MDREGKNKEKMKKRKRVNLFKFPHSFSISSPFPHSVSIFPQPSCQAGTIGVALKVATFISLSCFMDLSKLILGFL